MISGFNRSSREALRADVFNRPRNHAAFGARCTGMTLKPFLTNAIFAASLVGCAIVESGDHVWFKEGATPHEQDAALATARVQATQARVTPQEERDMVIRSMTAQGWRLMDKSSAPSLKSDARRKTPIPMGSGTALP